MARHRRLSNGCGSSIFERKGSECAERLQRLLRVELRGLGCYPISDRFSEFDQGWVLLQSVTQERALV
jgi:hypothetical protein